MNRTIAYIIPSCSEGGAELPAISQINYLHQSGWEVYVIILSEITPILDKINLDPDRVLILKGSEYHYTKKSIRQVISQLGTFYRFIRNNRIQTVVAVMNLSHVAGRLARLRASLSGYKFRLIVYHQTSFYDTNPADTFLKKSLNFFNRILSGLTNERAVFISRHVKNVISSHQHVGRHAIVYNTILERIPDKESAKRIYNKLELSQYGFIILVPGRLHPVKGHKLLFEAADHLIREKNLAREDLHIIVAGSGWYRQDLENECKQRGLEERVTFTGQVPNETLLALHEFCNILVIPSLQEPLGNVAIEGLRTGTLTVSSDAGGLKEIIENEQNGLLFRAGDAMDLLDQLKRVFDKQTGIKSQDIINSYKSKFVLEKQMQNLLPLLKD